MSQKKNEFKEDKSKLNQEPEVEEINTYIDSRSKQKVIHSHELLHRGKEVFILHKGDQYLLRCTRNGKLILTK